MRSSSGSLAYAVLRATLGLELVSRGLHHNMVAPLVRAGAASGREMTLMSDVVRALSPWLTYAEVVVGGLVILGLGTRGALLLAGVVTAGTIAVHAYDDTTHLTSYLALVGVVYVLHFLKNNAFSLDAVLSPAGEEGAKKEPVPAASTNERLEAAGRREAPRTAPATPAEGGGGSGSTFVQGVTVLLADAIGPFAKVLIREELRRMGITEETMERSDCEPLIVAAANAVAEEKRATFTAHSGALIPQDWVAAGPLPLAAPEPPEAAAEPSAADPKNPDARPDPTGPEIIRAIVGVAASTIGASGATTVEQSLAKMGLTTETMEWLHFELLVDSIANEIADDKARNDFIERAAAMTRASVAGK